MKKNLRIYLTAFTLFAAGLGYLVWAGLNEGAAYHIDVSDALDMPTERLQAVRIFGTVSSENIVRGADSLGITFSLQDQNTPSAVITVVYKGAVPESFKPGIELYAEGNCTFGADGTKLLQASGLTTKCPSKYKKENKT